MLAKPLCLLSLSPSPSLSLSNEPSHETRTRSTSIHRKSTTHALIRASSAGAFAAPVAATVDPSSRRKVSASAENNTRSSWVLHRPTARGLHNPFTAAVATRSRRSLVPSPTNWP